MAKALLIAEKNSVARTINAYIKRYGFKDDVTCAALSGHLVHMVEPNKYCEEWDGKWNLEVLPMIPRDFKYEVINDDRIKKIYSDLKQVIRDNHYDYLINACDPEREGQAIFYYVYNKMGCKLPVKRYWENGQTDASVKHALNNLRDGLDETGYPNLKLLTQAAYLRGQFDWLVGMNFTRAASLTMNGVAKVGRVKTAVLKICVDLEKRIIDFVPKTSYGIKTEIAEDIEAINVERLEEDSRVKYVEANYETKEEASTICETLPKSMKLISKDTLRLKDNPDKLFSLGTLQVAASKEYGYSVEQTLAIAQSLYEKKILSYPRTSNPYISSNEASLFDEMLNAIKMIPGLEGVVTYIGDKKTQDRVKTNKMYVNDKETKEAGHYALIPTGERFNFDSLSSEEKSILKLVAYRFAAIFMPSGIDEKTTYIFDAGSKYFRTTIYNTLELGYRSIYNDTPKKSKKPNINKGDMIKVSCYELYEMTSTPPRRLTDGRLVDVMINPQKYLLDNHYKKIIKETKGLGTDATRANIINELAKDKYIEIKGKGNLIYATPTGIKIIENLGDMEITSVDLTAKWETKLYDVSTGKLSVDDFKSEMLEYIKRNTEVFKNKRFNAIGDKANGRESVGKCPSCGGNIFEALNSYYCENFKREGPGCKVILSKSIKGSKVTKANLKKILAGKESTEISLIIEKDGIIKSVKKKLYFNPDSGKIEFVRPQYKALTTCSFCGGIVNASDKAAICSGCGISFARKIKGAVLEDEDLISLYHGQPTKELRFSTIKDGIPKKFNASLIYNYEKRQLGFHYKEAKKFGKCPICGEGFTGPIEGKYGAYYKCSNKVCGLIIKEEIGGVKLTSSDIDILLKGDSLPVKEFKKNDGIGSYKAALFVNRETKKLDRKFSK